MKSIQIFPTEWQASQLKMACLASEIVLAKSAKNIPYQEIMTSLESLDLDSVPSNVIDLAFKKGNSKVFRSSYNSCEFTDFKVYPDGFMLPLIGMIRSEPIESEKIIILFSINGWEVRYHELAGV